MDVQDDILRELQKLKKRVQSLEALEALALLDEDDFASDSALAAASQQSVKAYVDDGDFDLLDEDDFSSDSAIAAASQKSIAALVAHYGLFERNLPIIGGDDANATSRKTIELTYDDSERINLVVNDKLYIIPDDTTLNVDTADDWDTTSGTDYTIASNRAGKDFYIYACEPSVASRTPDVVLSVNSTVPTGYTADTSRKIGGFHCLCVSVGTIASHDLTGYLQGDILPASVWDLLHRPKNKQPEGMVYSDKANIWVDIYLQSGTGASTASAYGGTVTVSREWLNHIGSNEKTNIAGSSAPGTTGGHVDTASRRMISNIGCEDCAGAYWQWLLTPSAKLDNGTAGGWQTLPDNKGSFYTYGTNGYGNTQLRAGGNWSDGTRCGSRSRNANNNQN